MPEPSPNGFLLVDKEPGLTSHDVVAQVRKRFHERRVGHGGTLDPDATGLLVVALGPSTRLLSYCSMLDKTYIGELTLGTTTSTLDASGTVSARFDMAHVGLEDVRAAAARFIGSIDQVPPMVSAVQIGGKRLYELERAGIEVERAPRRVEIAEFSIEPTERAETFAFVVTCSSGAYVRSLCDDLGRALGGGAHMSSLRRVRIGQHGLDRAQLTAALSPADVSSPYGLVSHLETRRVAGGMLADVLYGKVLARKRLDANGDGPFAICAEDDDELLAIYQPYDDERVKPALVLSSAQQRLAGQRGVRDDAE